MKSIWAVIVVLVILAGSSPAQDECSFGGQQAFDAMAKTLIQEPSCQRAAEKMHECAWGSSADAQLAPIVISKCEKTFFTKLSSAGKEHYQDEMQLCAYEYSKAQGTMAISEAALCQLDIAAKFAADPRLAERPLSHTGFDCERAESSIEKAVCSNKRLGHADIVLNRVYRSFQAGLPKDSKSDLVASQKEWLRAISRNCGVSEAPLSLVTTNCLVNEYEDRFTDLSMCFDSPEEQNPAKCLRTAALERKASGKSEVEASGKVRASFDCEQPKSALQLAICADFQLGRKDIELSESYVRASHALKPDKKALLAKSENEWIRYVQKTCPMGATGGIPPVLTRSCIRAAFETRTTQLNECIAKEDDRQIRCLNDFKLFADK